MGSRLHFIGKTEAALIGEDFPDPWSVNNFDPVKYLALMIKVWPQLINRVLDQKVESFYQERWIPKADGGSRLLLVPQDPLRFIQRRIARRVLRQISVSSSVHGFVVGRGIVSNAYAHLGAECAYTLDLKDAFSSVTDERVVWELWRLKVDEFKIGWSLASLIAQLCTLEHPALGYGYRLPQGASTSPALFNLACGNLDRRLGRFAATMGGIYTRYADNVSISARRPITDKERHIIRKIVTECRFEINEAKTKLMHASGHSVLRFPGLILSRERVALSRRKLRQLRAAIHFAAMHGEEDRLRGLVSYAHQVYGTAIPRQILGVVPPPQLLQKVGWRQDH
jgi:retron-type reverse transcriptase